MSEREPTVDEDFATMDTFALHLDAARTTRHHYFAARKRIQAHVEAAEAHEQDAHRAWNEAKGEAFKLRSRVEALEGWMQEIADSKGFTAKEIRQFARDRLASPVARAALAGAKERHIGEHEPGGPTE